MAGGYGCQGGRLTISAYNLVSRLLGAVQFYAPEQIGRVLGVSAQAAGLRIAELELGREQAWWGDYL